jgi:glycosyltransferase involved in cell wall biosynthesis
VRVLYLTMNPNRESTTVPTEGWFRLLRPKGLEPVLVSSKVGAFQAWAASEGIPSYKVPLPFPNRRRPLAFLSSLARVVAIGRRHRVELVHCNEHDIYPIGQYAARLLRVPVVLSVHFTLRDGFAKWAFGGRRCPARVFFISRGSLEVCRPDVEGVVAESRWRLLYNGIDLDRFRPDDRLRAAFRAEHGLGGARLIGVACALRPRKQLEHLFEAAARVPDARVVVAGGPVGGDETYAAQLLDKGRELLGDRLTLVGHLRDLRPFYNALDLFVNTSQEEACSISVIESMACGCPVVGYPSTSVDEQVLPTGGEIVPQDSIVDLARALGQWLSDADRLAASRAQARTRAETMFDRRRLADQLWSEYRSLVPGVAERQEMVESAHPTV